MRANLKNLKVIQLPFWYWLSCAFFLLSANSSWAKSLDVESHQLPKNQEVSFDQKQDSLRPSQINKIYVSGNVSIIGFDEIQNVRIENSVPSTRKLAVSKQKQKKFEVTKKFSSKLHFVQNLKTKISFRKVPSSNELKSGNYLQNSANLNHTYQLKSLITIKGYELFNDTSFVESFDCFEYIHLSKILPRECWSRPPPVV